MPSDRGCVIGVNDIAGRLRTNSKQQTANGQTITVEPPRVIHSCAWLHKLGIGCLLSTVSCLLFVLTNRSTTQRAGLSAAASHLFARRFDTPVVLGRPAALWSEWFFDPA